MSRYAQLCPLACTWLLGCSFVDDFDKFRAADASRVDAGAWSDGAAGADDAAPTELDGQSAEDADSTDVAIAPDGAPPPVDCVSASEGTSCGQGLVCRFKACQASVCGDGIVDPSRGEQCDEPNQVRGDGCEPVTCTYSCDEDDDCDDARVCNGRERCDLGTHRCTSGTSASAQGMTCTNAASAAGGTCRLGLCVPELCGNGELDPGESCEPAMANCRADCQPGCRSDADCRNDDACDGEERCDATTRECQRGARVECVDADDCTVNGICDPASGCMFRLIDEDRDGYSPPGCAASSGREPDCNDTNVTVSPGAVERCDGLDNDCDGQIDDGVLISCFADRDADGYPSRDEVRRGCQCPPRSIAIANPASYEEWDCWDEPLDRGRDVHPGQTAFFEDGYGPGGRSERSFDYDCDGVPTPRYAPIDVQGCTGLLGLLCAEKQGFMRPPPQCGESGSYVTCAMGPLACQGVEDTRKQACR